MMVLDAAAVRRDLDYPTCIALMREAMDALSDGLAPKTLRSAIDVGGRGLFGVMPGVLGGNPPVFGAKLLGIFPEPGNPSHRRHQGVIALFDGDTGAPLCIVDAEAVTAIRTASASAAATEALARRDACHLAILGYGAQARSHVAALLSARRYDMVTIWGRDSTRAAQFADAIADGLGVTTRAAPDVASAVADADVVCTVTGATEPILRGAWIRPGTHVNVVGSSLAGPAEIDDDLVAVSRFFVDSLPSALSQAAEFLNARAAGRVTDDHIVGEIGDVFADRIPGRGSADEITVYKSLGHIVQDLAAARFLAGKADLLAGAV